MAANVGLCHAIAVWHVFRKKICRPFRSSQSGNFKEESASWIGKSPSQTSVRKCLAGESSAQEVKIGHVTRFDGSCILRVPLLFRWIMDGPVALVGMFVYFAMADALIAVDQGQAGSKPADPREHIEKLILLILVHFRLTVKRNP